MPSSHFSDALNQPHRSARFSLTRPRRGLVVEGACGDPLRLPWVTTTRKLRSQSRLHYSRLARGIIVTGCLILLVLVCSTTEAAQSITLAWDPSSDPDIAGYHLYYGPARRKYDRKIDLGNVTTTTISDLADGSAFYFAVTAYNDAALESPPSNEVTIPVPRKFLANVSVRTFVQEGSVMIGGFILSGEAPKEVILRALGPSLANAGITGAMTDPILELRDSTGALIISNDIYYEDTPEFAPSNAYESAISAALSPGAYTAVLRSVSGSSGLALFELYDLDPISSRIVNISSRGSVGTGENVMIGGFIIGGDQPTRVIVRALGPSLTAFGVSDALQDPILELHDGEGSLIFQNDDWRSSQEHEIVASSIPPSNDKESAIVATLPPGNYSAIVGGSGNSTGVTLVEVYNLEKNEPLKR